MPKPAKAWIVLKDFDFVPRPGVVQTFLAGTEVRGLTRECVARGMTLRALAPKEKANG